MQLGRGFATCRPASSPQDTFASSIAARRGVMRPEHMHPHLSHGSITSAAKSVRRLPFAFLVGTSPRFAIRHTVRTLHPSRSAVSSAVSHIVSVMCQV